MANPVDCIKLIVFKAVIVYTCFTMKVSVTGLSCYDNSQTGFAICLLYVYLSQAFEATEILIRCQ